MSDYFTDIDILRGKMAQMLAENTEQFVWVITNALSAVDIHDAIEEGRMGDEAHPRTCIINLRMIANAIEEGQLT